MPLRVAHAVGGDPVDVRCLDRTAIAAEGGEAHVVQHDVHDFGASSGALGGSYGAQSGLESRMSTLTVPRNSEAIRPTALSSRLPNPNPIRYSHITRRGRVIPCGRPLPASAPTAGLAGSR